MTLVDEYLRLYTELSKQHGKIALLMQVGSFYEIYSTDTIGNAREVSRCLNMKLTRKKKKDSTSPYMAGFMCSTAKDHIPILVKNDFVVIVMDQKAKGTLPETYDRNITNVICKSTDLESEGLINNVMSIYVKEYEKGQFTFATATVDVTRSKTVYTQQVDSTKSDKTLGLDRMIETIMQNCPVECVVVGVNSSKQQQFVRDCGIKCPVTFQHEESIILEEFSTYSKPIRCCLTLLFNYLSSRFINTEDISIEPYNDENYLDLTSTAIEQLDLSLLIDILDFTMTHMGKRKLVERIKRPFIDKRVIIDSLDSIENMTDSEIKTVRNSLQNVCDLERSHVKMSLGKLSPVSFNRCIQSYKNVTKLLPHDDEIAVFIKKLLETVKSDLSLDVCTESFMWNDRLFATGKQQHIDSLFKKKNLAEDYLHEMKISFEQTLGKSDSVHIKDADISGFRVTAKRAEMLKNNHSDIEIMKVTKSEFIVSNESIRQSMKDLQTVQDDIIKSNMFAFAEYQKNLYNNYTSQLAEVVDFISTIDFVQNAKTVAKKYKHVRPVFSDTKKMHVESLRHPIIERLQEDTLYIPNNIELSPEKYIGYVIYGVNAGGKTSLLKSAGIAVVMAQAGMYVAADRYECSIFKRIMTRISGSDNMLRGQSSFIVELEELRSILLRADSSTLVLGDEMCRGTEVQSATAIVQSILYDMSSKNCFFLTATHLFDLSEKIENLENVKIVHTESHIDETGDVIFTRKLADGTGRSLFGLEIARSMGFPKSFIDTAISLRDNTLIVKPSRYNSKKLLVYCEICKYRPKNTIDLPLDCHHINFQCNAENGFHGTQNKDALHNLMSLCKNCHIKVHTKQLNFKILQTLNGRKIQIIPFEDSLSVDGK